MQLVRWPRRCPSRSSAALPSHSEMVSSAPAGNCPVAHNDHCKHRGQAKRLGYAVSVFSRRPSPATVSVRPSRGRCRKPNCVQRVRTAAATSPAGVAAFRRALAAASSSATIAAPILHPASGLGDVHAPDLGGGLVDIGDTRRRPPARRRSRRRRRCQCRRRATRHSRCCSNSCDRGVVRPDACPITSAGCALTHRERVRRRSRTPR